MNEDTKQLLKEKQLRKDILNLRQAIRYHRDQKGDDRCWLDDYLVWKGIGQVSEELPSYKEGMEKCRAFHKYRNSAMPDHLPDDAICDPNKWDEDLLVMDYGQLTTELTELRQGIMNHREIKGRERTADDDRRLYSLLPEKLPADFRLPEEQEFLGTTKANAGCPNFWNSHASCSGKHNLRQWGPCNENFAK